MRTLVVQQDSDPAQRHRQSRQRCALILPNQFPHRHPYSLTMAGNRRVASSHFPARISTRQLDRIFHLPSIATLLPLHQRPRSFAFKNLRRVDPFCKPFAYPVAYPTALSGWYPCPHGLRRRPSVHCPSTSLPFHARHDAITNYMPHTFSPHPVHISCRSLCSSTTL